MRLAKKWNQKSNRLWLFSASSNLCVLLKPGLISDGDGGVLVNKEPEFEAAYGGVNKANVVKERIPIPNDGGDW